ncbi:MAG: hypothetical protein Tsb008_12770 [Rhodothalassiaceae bacterium]
MAAGKDYSAEIDAIKNDVTSLREDIGKLVGALGEDLGERGADARAEALRRFEALEARGRAAGADLERRIEENPLTALAAALGIGFLIGALLSRR